jgi:hypothetical protein
MYVPTSLYDVIVTGLNATEIISGASYISCPLRSSLEDCLELYFSVRTKEQDYGGVVSTRILCTEIIYLSGYPVTVPYIMDANGAEMCYFRIVPTDRLMRLLGATFVRSTYLDFDADKTEITAARAKRKM